MAKDHFQFTCSSFSTETFSKLTQSAHFDGMLRGVDFTLIYTAICAWETTITHTNTPPVRWLHRDPRRRLQSTYTVWQNVVIWANKTQAETYLNCSSRSCRNTLKFLLFRSFLCLQHNLFMSFFKELALCTLLEVSYFLKFNPVLRKKVSFSQTLTNSQKWLNNKGIKKEQQPKDIPKYHNSMNSHQSWSAPHMQHKHSGCLRTMLHFNTSMLHSQCNENSTTGLKIVTVHHTIPFCISTGIWELLEISKMLFTTGQLVWWCRFQLQYYPHT